MALRRDWVSSTLVLIVFSTFLVNVGAQSTTIPFIAGTTNQPPSINGQWEPGEWDNAAVYNITIGAPQVKPRPTVRLLHDNATLYGLVDVPSDTGGTYVDSSGKPEWGMVTLYFWYGPIFSWPTPATSSSPPWFWFIVETNQTGLASTNTEWYPSSNRTIHDEGYLLYKHSSASTSLTTTSLSKTKHRIWEFSVQVFPYVVHQTLTQNGTNIGFNVQVWDSSGNLMEFVAVSQPGRLFFVATTMPVPEVSSAMVMPFALLVSLLLLRKRKRNCSGQDGIAGGGTSQTAAA